MKVSRFNLIIPTKNGEYFLYNSLSQATITIDDEFKEIIVDENKLDQLPPQYIPSLKKMGIIIDDDKEELLKYRYMLEKRKYDTSHSDFIIFPTNNCNLQCKYCYESDYNDRSATMDTDRVERVIEFIKWQTLQNKSKWCVISLFGGEPLFAKKQSIRIVNEIKSWANNLGIITYVSMASNGVLITPELVNDLFPNIDTVQVTLDGPKRVHDTLRIYKSGKGSYDEIIKGLKLLKDGSTHISLRIHVDIRDGLDKLLINVKECLLELEELGFKDYKNLNIYFAQTAPPNACDQFIEKEFFLPAEKYGIEIFPKIWNLANQLGWKNKLDTKQAKIAQNILYCGYAKLSTYVISPSLELHICPVFTGYSEYKVGVINERGRPVWNNKYYDVMARDPLLIGCGDCPYLPFCGGGCPIRTYMDHKTFYAKNCWTKKELSFQRVEAHFRYRFPGKFDQKQLKEQEKQR